MSSLWTENIEMPEFPTLEKDIRTQVLIIGGGMAGVLCAYFLQQAGVDYCLLEKDRICQGVTGHTTAKITAQHGLIYEKSLQSMGQERAELFLKANLRAVENYKSLGRFLDCDMEETDSYLYSVRERRKLESEIQALGSLGFQADYTEDTELPFEVEGAIRFPRQAQFQPLKFAAGISKNLRIYEHSEVREMTEYFALTEKGSVAAEKIIIATHFPFINTRGSYYLKLYQNRSYVLACAYGKNLKGMYLEADNIGLSLRNYEDYLLIGGGGHRSGKEKNNWDLLRDIAKEYFPEAKERYFWATQDCMSLDKRPYIGPYSKNTPDLFVATGFGKWGMTGSMLSAMILSDLVQEKNNEYSTVFSPSRNMLKPQLISNLGHALVGIGRIGGKRCSHMGCVLQWNKEEQTWECPCHGSSFSADGKVLDNPACDGLKKLLIILFVSFLGELLKYIIPLSIPASIYGMVLLFLALELKILKVSDIKETSNFLIEIMPLMFVPAGVGLLDSWGALQSIWIQVVVITLISTVIVMGVSGSITQFVIRKGKKKEE